METQLWTVGVGITSLCNMSCLFCYSREQRKADDLETDVWTAFMDNNAKVIRAINYGTGENTLSEAWYELIAYVRQNFPWIRQALTTNGFLAEAIKDCNKAKIIKECIDEIDVSIDFADSLRHDTIRGFTGAFDMALSTLRYCRDNGKLATIVALGLNDVLECANLAKIFDLAEEYDALMRLNLYRHVNESSSFYPPSFLEVIKALDWIIKKYTVVSISEPVFKSVYGITNRGDDSCAYSVRILPNGNITPSTYLISEEWVAGNILSGMVLDDLIHTNVFMRFWESVIPEKCEGCLYKETCKGGTRDRRFLKWGRLDDTDIYCPRDINGYFTREREVFPKLLDNKRTVHSDYLPTMIFSPIKNGGECVKCYRKG